MCQMKSWLVIKVETDLIRDTAVTMHATCMSSSSGLEATLELHWDMTSLYMVGICTDDVI